MTIWNSSSELAYHLRQAGLKICLDRKVQAPEEEPRDWEDGDAIQEGDIVRQIGFNGWEWRQVVPGKPSTGMASRNYHPATGGDWKLGHRD